MISVDRNTPYTHMYTHTQLYIILLCIYTCIYNIHAVVKCMCMQFGLYIKIHMHYSGVAG